MPSTPTYQRMPRYRAHRGRRRTGSRRRGVEERPPPPTAKPERGQRHGQAQALDHPPVEVAARAEQGHRHRAGRRQQDQDGQVGEARASGSRPPRPADHEGDDGRQPEGDAQGVVAHVAGLEPADPVPVRRTSAASAVDRPVDDPAVDHRGAEAGQRLARAGRSRRRRSRPSTRPAGGTPARAPAGRPAVAPQPPGDGQADHGHHGVDRWPAPTGRGPLCVVDEEAVGEHRLQPGGEARGAPRAGRGCPPAAAKTARTTSGSRMTQGDSCGVWWAGRPSAAGCCQRASPVKARKKSRLM